MKKNCINCKFLEYVDSGDWGITSGYCCNNRDYKTSREEDNHLGQLENEKYLKTSKKCCLLKEKGGEE